MLRRCAAKASVGSRVVMAREGSTEGRLHFSTVGEPDSGRTPMEGIPAPRRAGRGYPVGALDRDPLPPVQPRQSLIVSGGPFGGVPP